MTEPQTNQEKLIQVAIDLFSEKGFKGTSIRDIATEMGMSISNIYHYFGSKEGLWLATLEHSAKTMLEELRQVSEMDMEPMARFKLLFKTHYMLIGGKKREAKLFLTRDGLPAEGINASKTIQREILEIYVKVLRELEAMGLVKHKSLKILALNIFGTLNWQVGWYRPEGALSLLEIAEQAISFVLHGILGGNDPKPGSDKR